MSKKNLVTILLMIIFFIGLAWIIFFEGRSNVTKSTENYDLTYDEIRGVWLSYLELDSLLKGKSEKEFKNNINKVIDNLKDAKFNTLVVQVRPFSDAIYNSKYYPTSYYCSGEEGKKINFDPLEMIVKEAHKNGIRVEAWINPYRVRNDNTDIELSKDNPAKVWQDEKSDNVIEWSGGLYYNPAKEEVRNLIINGIKEIIENYSVDGIHFDDYFYPTNNEEFDKTSYAAYKEGGGILSLQDWRRENVNILVKESYSAIKAINNKVVFGISPQGSMDNNYNSQFIDVQKWVQNSGYVDYICPQIYYGFKNSSNNFQDSINKFNEMIKIDSVKLYIGLAAYKIGTEDKWAGTGSNEWIEGNEMLKNQIEASRKLSNYGGVCFFRYDSLFNPSKEKVDQIKKELNDVKKIFN